MRFDPDRVVAHASEPGSSAPDDSVSMEAEFVWVQWVEAETKFVERLSATGWRCEEVPAESVSLPMIPIVGSLLGWFWVELQWVEPGFWPLFRLGLACLLFATLGCGFARSGRKVTYSADEIPLLLPRHVLAKDGRDEPRPVRLVLFARLPGWQGWSRWGLIAAILVLLLTGAALLSPWKPEFLRGHHRVAWGILIAQGFCLWIVVGRIFLRGRSPDRTGLPMLAELARTWPKGVSDRVETWVIATPNVSDVGKALGRRFNDATPTLAIGLDSPGTGPDLIIAGRGEAAELAANAASALWIPHRRSRFIPGDVALQKYGWNRVPCVSLLGTHETSAIDPAALARVAQLVTEIAFRWGKRATDAQGVSRARSSQNPG